MTDAFFSNRKSKALTALLLTFVSGMVDIIGYLGIYKLFTAHMTGTTVHLASSLAYRDESAALAAGVIVASFFLGSVLGRVVVEMGSRERFRTVASATLTLEIVLIVAVAMGTPLNSARPVLGVFFPYWRLAFLSGAMGLQTATLTRIGALTVHTTFVTGMINKLAQLVSHVLFRSYDLFRRSEDEQKGIRATRNQDARRALFLFAIWCLYLGGAASGALLYRNWNLSALYFAAGLLVVPAFTDQIWPLSLEEEKEQSER